MNIKNIGTVEFDDHADEGCGVFIVRRCDERVAICMSLEQNGDIEALVEKEVIERLIGALKQAIEG